MKIKGLKKDREKIIKSIYKHIDKHELWYEEILWIAEMALYKLAQGELKQHGKTAGDYYFLDDWSEYISSLALNMADEENPPK